MGIGPNRSEVGIGKTSWLGSRHGVAEAHAGTLDAAAFGSADGVVDGVVPSGYPVALVDGLYVPFDGEGDGGVEVLAGFSLYDRDITTGDEPTAVVWHGRIRVADLPVDFDPTDATGSAFVFDTEGV